MLKILLLIFFAGSFVEAEPNSTEQYKMSETLKKGGMMLYWKIREDIITIEVKHW